MDKFQRVPSDEFGRCIHLSDGNPHRGAPLTLRSSLVPFPVNPNHAEETTALSFPTTGCFIYSRTYRNEATWSLCVLCKAPSLWHNASQVHHAESVLGSL